MRWPKAGDAVCHTHGGKSLRGAASPSFKHGRYSSVLKELGLDRRYQERIRDPELARLQHYLAFLDARHEQLLEQIVVHRDDVRAAMADLRTAQANEDPEKTRAALDTVQRQHDAGAALWREAYKVGDLRRKAAAAESLTLGRLNQMMTAEQVSALNLAVYQAVNAAVLSLVTELNLDTRYHGQVMQSIGQAIRRLLSDSTGADVVLN